MAQQQQKRRTSTRTQTSSKLLSIVTAGSAGCGKSCLTDRLVGCDKFDANCLPTIGVDVANFSQQLQQQPSLQGYQIQIYDCSGQSRFKVITKSFYKYAHVALLVYDASKRGSFDQLPQLLEQLHNECPADAVIILVASKVDKCRDAKAPHHREDDEESADNHDCVTKSEAAAWAEDRGIEFCETSAASNQGVDFLRSQLLNILARRAQLELQQQMKHLENFPLQQPVVTEPLLQGQPTNQYKSPEKPEMWSLQSCFGALAAILCSRGTK